MIFGYLNLGVDEFLVKAFENIVGDKVFVYAIRYDEEKDNTREILDFINKEYVEEYSYDVLLPHYERTYNKGHVSGLNILFTEEFINNSLGKLCFNEEEPVILKHGDYLIVVIVLGKVVFVDHLTKMEWARMLKDISRY